MPMTSRGISLIRRFEGLRLRAYADAVGVPTIGYGHTRSVTAADVAAGRTITEQQADELLRQDVAEFEAGVAKLVTRKDLRQSQFEALVCFSYNVGLDIDADTKAEGLGDSTLLVLVNAGRDQDAAAEFLKWNKAGGRALLGLTRRRLAEAQLYLEDL